MIKAAGACIIAKDTKRIILQQRDKFGSHPRNWGFWGGKVEDNENISQALLREVCEELNLNIKKDMLAQICRRDTDDLHSTLAFAFGVVVARARQ